MPKVPVILFVYNRLDTAKLVISALKNNTSSLNTDLFVFSDGPKNLLDQEQVEQVRSFLKSISGFKSITIQEAKSNKGLANSIIAGVSEVFEQYEEVIVLEDDLVTSPNFLDYMNQALYFYKSNPKVFSISAFTFPIQKPEGFPFDCYFTRRASSWGWATWKNRWEDIDWAVTDYDKLVKSPKAIQRFNEMGSDMFNMLSRHMKGSIDSWAIRWCYHQFKNDSYTAFPFISKVTNIGFGQQATHTKEKFNRFASTPLDDGTNKSFKFNSEIELDPYFIKQFTKKYSYSTRIFYKLRNYLGV